MAQIPQPPQFAPMPAQASYRDKFSDAAYDTFNGNYAAVMELFHVPLQNNNAPAANDIQNFACNARANGPTIPTAFLLLQEDGQIHCYHSISKFVPRLGMPATGWDDNMFVTKGELYRNTASTTFWLPEYFHQVPGQHRVATPATIDTTLGADPNVTELGPYGANDAGTELVRCRRSTFLPPKYVPLMMDPMSPRRAWETLRGQIVNDGKEVECKPLIQWLQFALVRTAPNQAFSPLAIEQPAAPIADHVLLEHRHRILIQDFPTLDAAHHVHQQNQIANQVGNLCTVIQQENVAAENRRSADKNKSPEDLLGDSGLSTLLRLCQVANVNGLPPFWTKLTNAKKSQHLSILQFAIDEIKLDNNMPHLQFVATPALLNKVKSLAFAMSDLHDLKSGIQPFVLGEVKEALASITVEMYKSINADHAAPSISDVRQLLACDESIPRLLFHARESIQRLSFVTQVILGTNHQFVRNLEEFLTEFPSRESMLARYVPKSPGGSILLPVLLNKYIANHASVWFRRQSQSPAAIAAPRFVTLFEKMELDDPSWEPTLSRHLLSSIIPSATDQLRGSSQVPGGGASNPTPPPTQVPLPDPPQNPDPPAPPAKRQARVNNPWFLESHFGAFRGLRGVTVRAIRDRAQAANVALPRSKVDPSKPCCLAWHSRGMCNEACGLAFDHVEYTADEAAPIKAWCDEHFHA